MKLCLTIAVSMIGAWIALRCKVPAGALIGAMLGTIVLNLTCEMAYMPMGLKLYTQIATGAYVGAKISKSDAQGLRTIMKPAMILSGVMLCFTVAVGWLICRISDLTVATALFSMAPAGITDMTLASMDFDAEPSVVALIQTMRIIFTICLLPPIIRQIAKRHPQITGSRSARVDERRTTRTIGDLGTTMLIALLCGTMGKALGIPGGAIAFSMAGCAWYNICFDKGYMPLRLRQFIQVFAGALIGCTVSRQQVIQMLELYDVVILAVVSFVVLDLVAAAVIACCTDMDHISALFSCAPGGLTDMALIADDMGADSVKVAGMHLLRLISVIAFYPAIISILLPLLEV